MKRRGRSNRGARPERKIAIVGAADTKPVRPVKAAPATPTKRKPATPVKAASSRSVTPPSSSSARKAPADAPKEPVAPVGSQGSPSGDECSPPGPGPHFLVAAVGASAGGWLAFSGLLRSIPVQTPMALLLVQHLSPDHESALPQLLETVTKLPIETARDRVHIQPGRVYVIPPGAVMTVVDGMLSVALRTDSRLSDGLGPVDALFHSVAEVYGQHAVGVVLSGSGNDGAAGAKQIKAAGGLVLAQSPDEAEIDAMPRAAIAAGAVDAIISVGEIGDQLTRLAGHPFYRRQPTELDPELELPTAFAYRRRIFQLLRRATGVDFNNYKPPTITRRIQRRMVLHRVATLADYVSLLERDSSELNQLQADLLIHVTSFFREPGSFAALAENVLPDMIRDRGDGPFRVWVPGCSTGEEAYSVVMVILECMGDRIDHASLQVFGTDVSEATINVARAGTYPASIAVDVPPERLRRFFSPFNTGFRVNKSVRDRCVFARQDLTRDPPFSRLDLIVCRNLLIYLKQPTQRKVVSIFHYALNAGGVLMLGHSETVGPGADLFSVIDKRHQIYTRKAGRVGVDIDFTAPPPIDSPPDAAGKPPRPARLAPGEWDAQSEANRVLLDRYAPPALILDSSSRIIRARGDTTRYVELASGDVTLDVVRMVRPELLFAVRSSITEALSTGRPALRAGVRLTIERQPTVVDLHAVPVGSGENRQIMLLFEEAPAAIGKEAPPQRGRRNGTRVARGAAAKGLVAELQVELAETRQQLQRIIDDLGAANEELQSANEEVLSSNEELQSTNEELDTAKEELQSTNEELSTLNDELHGRNFELMSANNDLLNLLASVQIPIVMVSHALRIRRFTPAAEGVMNIIPSDIGRPIGHLKPNFRCPDLEGLIEQVIRSGSDHTGEVETQDGRLFAMQIRRYKVLNNQVDGAVLALIDVSSVRQQETARLHNEDTEDAFLDLAKEPTVMLQADFGIHKANNVFGEQLGRSVRELQGRSFFEVAGGAFDRPELHQLLETTLPAADGWAEIVLESAGKTFAGHPVRVRGRRMTIGQKRASATLLLFEDITKSAQA